MSTSLNVIFFGTPHFAVPGLEALLEMPNIRVVGVVTQPDRPAGRGGSIQASPIKQLAVAHGIPVLQPRSIRKELPTFMEELARLGPCDIGVVIAFGQILPLPLLTYPKSGCVNVHASLLPRWRGAAPIHRALLAGDAETGICLMEMEEGLDTGGVYAKDTTAITKSDTVGALHDRLAQMGGALLKKHLNQIACGELRAVPQPQDGVTYASKITAKESQIDWSCSASAIDLTVRGFNPFPGAYTWWQGKRMKILAGTPFSDVPSNSQSAGKITEAQGDRLEVATGEGTFRITALQLEGKRRMSVPEFLNGNTLSSGACLEYIEQA